MPQNTDRPLLRLSTSDHPPYAPRARDSSPATDSDDEEDDTPKRWFHYAPTALLVFLLLAPQPSWLIVLVKFHLEIMHARFTFLVHLLVSYTLTFLACSSLIVCVARDPGPIPTSERHEETDDNGETSITQALMVSAPEDYGPGKWCKKCNAPKPERAHHCSYCRRCVLKMDHHCPWIAYKCIGHRTYPAFVHFLFCVTTLSLYIGAVSISAIYFAFTNPEKIDETTPVHELGLSFAGIIFTVVVGSFLGYHIYLITTNQTTLEGLSPFLLLREVPDVPGINVYGPPREHQLSYPQRRIVKRAHAHVRLYDVGWRQNWAQVFGWERKWGWLPRILIGGAAKGDGRSFQRNPRADELLARLAQELADSDRNL